jgi:hypothetical protein
MAQGRRRLRRTGARGVGSEGARRQGWRRLRRRLRLRLRLRLCSDVLVCGRVGIAVGSCRLLASRHGAVARRLRRPAVHCALAVDEALLRGLGRLRGGRGGVLCVWVRDAQPAEGLGQAEVAIHRGSLWAARAVSGRSFSKARRVQWF